MMRPHSKSTKPTAKPLLAHRLTFLILLAMAISVLAFGVLGEQGLIRVLRLRNQTQVLERKIVDLQKSNETSRWRVQYLRHDPQASEEIARESLGLLRPGEMVFRFSRGGAQAGNESPQ